MTIFIGRETKTHILQTKMNEKKIAKVSPSNNNYSFPFNNNVSEVVMRAAAQVTESDPRMSVQMALAEASHHTAPRGQRTARAREEEREVHYTAAFRTTVPPPEPELFDLFEEPGGGRPDLLLEPQGPQLGVPRSTSLTSCRTCRFSMCLCRSWEGSWWNSCRCTTL